MSKIKSLVRKYWWVLAILAVYYVWIMRPSNGAASPAPATNSPLPDPASDPLLVEAFRR